MLWNKNDNTERFNRLREEYLELQEKFAEVQQRYNHDRSAFLTRQSKKLQSSSRMIKIYANIIEKRYEKSDDLVYCSKKILSHIEEIDEVAREIRLEGDKE